MPERWKERKSYVKLAIPFSYFLVPVSKLSGSTVSKMFTKIKAIWMKIKNAL